MVAPTAVGFVILHKSDILRRKSVRTRTPQVPDGVVSAPYSYGLKGWGPPGWIRHVTGLSEVVQYSSPPHVYDKPGAILSPQRLCLHKRVPTSSLGKKSSGGRGQLGIWPHTHCHAGYSHPVDRTNATLTLQMRKLRPSKVKQHFQGY